MAPSRDVCETLEALALYDERGAAGAMLDAGALHGDPECAAAGALLLFVRALAMPGAYAKVVRKMKAAALAVGRVTQHAA